MASPLTVTRNDFRLRPKRSDIYTPLAVARFLFDILSHTNAATVLDPAIGTGRLTDPWYDAGCATENPPFNGCTGRKLYPEVFLEHTFSLFGTTIPVVLFVPMGFRLNQRKKSTRWRWCRDCGAVLASIIALPLDIFPGVEFHAEILVFNVRGIRPHYFLTEEALQ